jgi:hypothetical protein
LAGNSFKTLTQNFYPALQQLSYYIQQIGQAIVNFVTSDEPVPPVG